MILRDESFNLCPRTSTMTHTSGEAMEVRGEAGEGTGGGSRERDESKDVTRGKDKVPPRGEGGL